eukprot:9481601-Pyramimonas_sp.AAC.1
MNAGRCPPFGPALGPGDSLAHLRERGVGREGKGERTISTPLQFALLLEHFRHHDSPPVGHFRQITL